MAEFDLEQLESEADDTSMLLPGQSASLGAEVRRRQKQQRPTTADGRKLTMAAMPPENDPAKPKVKFRYGEVMFEETGAKVPYLIIPNTDEGRDPATIVQYMVRHMKFNGRALSKPNMAFRVRARGASFMEWARDVHNNDFLAQKWGWKEMQTDETDSDGKPVVIPPDSQFAPTGLNGKLEPKSAEQLEREFPGAKIVEKLPLDNAIREFADKLVSIFRDVVTSTVQGDSWFLFPAGRRPRHQLIGDAIAKYGGELNNCVMVQYNSLQNPNLIMRGRGGPGEFKEGEEPWTMTPPDMDHDDFVQALRDCSVEIESAYAKQTPEVTDHVLYTTETEMFPKLPDIQGKCYDEDMYGNPVKNADGSLKEISVEEWVDLKCRRLGHRDISLHPSSTHLLFWDQPGIRRGGDQCLPWTEIDNLHDYLEAQGIAAGCMIANGDMADLNNALSTVAQSTPVLAVKSTGGASEFVSQLFERRQDGGPDDCGRKKGFQDRFPSDAVPEEFRDVFFQTPTDAREDTLIVVDCNNPDVGKVLMKEMANMLQLTESPEERNLGFAAGEQARLSKAWGWSLMYAKNARKERTYSNVLMYLMLLLNMALVIAVVYKVVTYDINPEASDDAARRALRELQPAELMGIMQPLMDSASSSLNCPGGVDAINLTDLVVPTMHRYLQSTEPDESEAEKAMSLLLVVLPIISGVLLTFLNAFNPIQKARALEWAGVACESEIYKYRTRAGPYAAVAHIAGWKFDDDEEADSANDEKKKEASKRFVDNIKNISGQVRAQSQMQISALSFFKDEELESMIEKKVSKLQERTCAMETEETVTKSDLEVNRLGLDQANKIPTAAQLEYYETNKNRVGKARMKSTSDNGFSQLAVDEYLAVRCKPALEEIQARLPPLSRRKELLQALTYVATSISVLLGTLKYDMYIAITTAAVSLLTGVLEYQKLEATIICLNNSSIILAHTLMWWDSLSFVEKRMGKHKDNLVATTEAAIMSETEAFYQSTEDLEEEDDGGQGATEED